MRINSVRSFSSVCGDVESSMPLDPINGVFNARLKHPRAEDMLRLAVDTCPSGMIMIDRTGKMLIVNREVDRLFGYSRDELLGQQVDVLVPERYRAQHFRHRDMFLEHPESRPMGSGRDLFGVRKDGTEFPVEIGLNPIEVGVDVYVLGAIVDISTRKRLERMKSEFVSTVSHELRTPMTSISASLSLIAAGAAGELPTNASRLISIAQANCDRLVRLINDILDIDRMETGEVTFRLECVDARSLIEEVVDATRGYAEKYTVPIRIDVKNSTANVRADRDRLAQVVTNLLSNAVKFSPHGTEVEVLSERRVDRIRVLVRDHGPGVPAEFKSHVFERFAQADATDARQRGGSGLGLHIVKQIVERMGGQVGFHDSPGGGTVFWFELPEWKS